MAKVVFDITTSIKDGSLIEQTVTGQHRNLRKCIQDTQRAVMDAKDEGIRQVLVLAGWTPPNDSLSHTERMDVEYEHLCHRCSKLSAFLHSEKGKAVTALERSLMEEQYQCMCRYRSALWERIRLTKKSQVTNGSVST